MTKFDLYDNAELLNLAILLNDSDTVEKLDKAIRDNFINKGKIYSTIDFLMLRKNANHLRWAVVPYLYALSNLKKK